MDGELVSDGMTWVCGAAPGPGGTCTAIALPLFLYLLLQQKRSPKRRPVWWNSPAQQTAHCRVCKPGETELKASPELREGAGGFCGILVARDCQGQPVVTSGIRMLEPADGGGEAGSIASPAIGWMCVNIQKVARFRPGRTGPFAVPVGDAAWEIKGRFGICMVLPDHLVEMRPCMEQASELLLQEEPHSSPGLGGGWGRTGADLTSCIPAHMKDFSVSG